MSDDMQNISTKTGTRGAVALCLLLALLTGGGLLFGNLTARPITSVRIAGEFVHVSRAELQQLVDGFLPSGFFELDVEAVRRKAATLPWVKQVSVRRIWPDSLHVAVGERVAVARWNGRALLGADGSLFVPEKGSLAGDYVDLKGPEGTEAAVLERYGQLQPLARALETNVSEVTLDERGSWRVDLTNELELRLGQEDDLESIAPYVAALPRILGSRYRDAERIDLRYSNGFAVRWRQKAEAKEEQAS